jgi:acyl-CoA reductase-like NAD-dependent aldehyde dehydrogenase
MAFISKNPYTGKILKKVAFNTRPQISAKIDALNSYFEATKNNDFSYRKNKIEKLGQAFSEYKKPLAEMIATEIGKPINQSTMEIQRIVQTCEFQASRVEEMCRTREVKTDGSSSGFRYKPMGVIHKIAPFNFPCVLIFKNVIPNLALGNCSLIRPPQTALGMAEILEDMLGKYDIGGMGNFSNWILN